MKRIFTFIAIVCLTAFSINVFAVSKGDTFTDDQGVTYEAISGTQAAITGIDGTTANVVVPSVIQMETGKCHVVSVADNAVNNNTKLYTLVLPKTIQTIGEYAFWKTTSLYKVEFEEGIKLQEIKAGAFSNCTGLIDIQIPVWTETIGGDTETFPHIRAKAFDQVPNIGYPITSKDKNYPWGARNVNGTVDGFLLLTTYDTDAKIQLFVCATAVSGAVVIPETVTKICARAFQNCVNMTSVLIPENIKTIESQLFKNCMGLTSIICKLTTPPVSAYYMDSYPEFDGVDENIPVYVPKGTIPAYQAADGWKKFKNYKEIDDQTIDDLTKYTVTLSVNDPAMGTVKGAGTFDGGSDVTIEAKANTGYKFVKWSDNNAEALRTIKLVKDTSLTAYFEADGDEPPAPQQFTITVSVNDPVMGQVTGGGVYEENADVTLTAVAFEGYEFVQWTDGVLNNVRSFKATKDAAYTAVFQAIQQEGIEAVQAVLNTAEPMFNLLGQEVDITYHGIVIQNGHKFVR